ncbi:MAG: hypothetical protein ACREA9_00415, partial [Pyrinomonadaceae bacterium]
VKRCNGPKNGGPFFGTLWDCDSCLLNSAVQMIGRDCVYYVKQMRYEESVAPLETQAISIVCRRRLVQVKKGQHPSFERD